MKEIRHTRCLRLGLELTTMVNARMCRSTMGLGIYPKDSLLYTFAPGTCERDQISTSRWHVCLPYLLPSFANQRHI